MRRTVEPGVGLQALAQHTLSAPEPTELPPVLQTERAARTVFAVIVAVGVAALLADALVARLRK